MGTVPTSYVEDALRAYFLRWLEGLQDVPDEDLEAYLIEFEQQSAKIINTQGTKVARRGSLAGFPNPKVIPLDVETKSMYSDMHKLAVKAGIGAGLQSTDVARQMFKQGMEGRFSDLNRFARTETTNAYWQHQWNQVEDLDMVMVWSPESSSRTCPSCLAKDGLVVRDKTLRDHPNGRCTLLPKLPNHVPLREASRNPQFTRHHRQKEYPAPSNPVYSYAFRGTMGQAIVADNMVAGAVQGMVSQGWSTGEAFRYLQAKPVYRNEVLTPEDKSLVYRKLEQYAQELYEGLTPGQAPEVLYRGGVVGPLGMSSWTSNPEVARYYALRHREPVYAMEVPDKLLTYKVGGDNQLQDEYVVLGMPRAIGREDGVVKGVLDGPTDLVPADKATRSLEAYFDKRHAR